MQRYFLRTDPAFSAALFAILATAYALTRSHWLDDWDSVQFALALDDFDLRKHQPHPPGYPVYIAAAKVLRTVVPDAAAALTLLSSLAGAACASLFFLITRRDLDRTTALASTLIMAVSPLFWLQAGLALTDMFGFFFVMLFILLEGTAPTTRAGTIWRAIGCGLVAGISIGARPHFTLLILVYWLARTFFIDRSRAPAAVAAAALFAGFLIWCRRPPQREASMPISIRAARNSSGGLTIRKFQCSVPRSTRGIFCIAPAPSSSHSRAASDRSILTVSFSARFF